MALKDYISDDFISATMSTDEFAVDAIWTKIDGSSESIVVRLSDPANNRFRPKAGREGVVANAADIYMAVTEKPNAGESITVDGITWRITGEIKKEAGVWVVQCTSSARRNGIRSA